MEFLREQAKLYHKKKTVDLKEGDGEKTTEEDGDGDDEEGGGERKKKRREPLQRSPKRRGRSPEGDQDGERTL